MSTVLNTDVSILPELLTSALLNYSLNFLSPSPPSAFRLILNSISEYQVIS